MTRIFIIVAAILFAVNGYAQNEKAEIEQVKQVVEEAINAMSNTGDIETMEKHFHPGFQLFKVDDNNRLEDSHFYNWLIKAKERKARNGYPGKEKIAIEFETVEVTGVAATTKFKYFKGDRHTCTDFFHLLKFKEGWRIVSAITYHHQD